jgi:DNA-binding CsgD family transcriptional regulator
MFPPRKGQHDHGNLRLADAGEIVDSLAETVESELPRREKIQSLIERFAGTIGLELDYHVLLLGELDRIPAPRVLERFTFGPTFSLIEPRPHDDVQALIDLCGPICHQAIPAALSKLHTPVTYIYGDDADSRWYNEIFRPRLLAPNRWADDLACYWSASPSRAIIYNAFRGEMSAPYTQGQRDLLSLACRAIGPILDDHVFDDVPAQLTDLDPRLYPLLLTVLQGFSRNEIAQHAGVVGDYVDMAMSQLFAHFRVNNRGQLIAKFVDDRITSWLEQAVQAEGE